MNRIRARGAVEVAAPAGEVFAYVANYENAPLFVPGLRRLRPVGGLSYGPGARFVAELGFAGLHCSLEFAVTRFDAGRLVEAQTTDGLVASSRWVFHARGSGLTTAEFECECELPRPLQGLAGRGLTGLVREAVRRSLEEGLTRLAEAFEALDGRADVAEAAERPLPA